MQKALTEVRYIFFEKNIQQYVLLFYCKFIDFTVNSLSSYLLWEKYFIDCDKNLNIFREGRLNHACAGKVFEVPVRTIYYRLRREKLNLPMRRSYSEENLKKAIIAVRYEKSEISCNEILLSPVSAKVDLLKSPLRISTEFPTTSFTRRCFFGIMKKGGRRLLLKRIWIMPFPLSGKITAFYILSLFP